MKFKKKTITVVVFIFVTVSDENDTNICRRNKNVINDFYGTKICIFKGLARGAFSDLIKSRVIIKSVNLEFKNKKRSIIFRPLKIDPIYAADLLSVWPRKGGLFMNIILYVIHCRTSVYLKSLLHIYIYKKCVLL